MRLIGIPKQIMASKFNVEGVGITYSSIIDILSSHRNDFTYDVDDHKTFGLYYVDGGAININNPNLKTKKFYSTCSLLTESGIPYHLKKDDGIYHLVLFKKTNKNSNVLNIAGSNVCKQNIILQTVNSVFAEIIDCLRFNKSCVFRNLDNLQFMAEEVVERENALKHLIQLFGDKILLDENVSGEIHADKVRHL